MGGRSRPTILVGFPNGRWRSRLDFLLSLISRSIDLIHLDSIVTLHLGRVLLLFHGFGCLSVGLDALNSSTEQLQCEDGGRAGPEYEAERSKDSISSSGSADLAAAEEEFAKEYGEGNEATEVEDGVENLEGDVNIGDGD